MKDRFLNTRKYRKTKDFFEKSLVFQVLCFLLLGGMLISLVHAQPGTVKTYQKISDTQGNFTGILDNSDMFGFSMDLIGDLDGDGITDMVVSAYRDDDGGTNRGAVWILFLNANGTVKSQQKISDTQGNFTGILDNNDFFGHGVAKIGDLDGDGIYDIVVGAHFDDDGGTDRGAVWILFLNLNGTVKSYQKISDTQGGFSGILNNYDNFGASVAYLGDLDGDSVIDIAVGAFRDNDGGFDRGAVWILFLNSNGTVKSHQKISDVQGNFTGILDNSDLFGRTVSSIGDLDGDSILDIVVGATLDDDGGLNKGAVWILFLNINGTVKSYQKISDTQGNFTGILDASDFFGISVKSTGDLDGDNVMDIIVGSNADDDGGTDRGAIWILYLNTNGTVKSYLKISNTQGNFSGILDNSVNFGVSVASLGDLNGDGMTDIAVGARFDDDGGSNRGAVWILFLDGVPVTIICSTFEDLNNTIYQALIDNEGVLKSLLAKATNAEKKFDQGNLIATSNILCALLNEVDAQKGKHIDLASALDIQNCVLTLAANSGISLPCQSGNLKLSNPSEMRFESYPNPANGSITITFSVPETDHISLKLYNFLGTHIQTLFEGIAEKNNIYSSEYNTKDLPRGTYYYLLTTPKQIFNRKIIIAR